MQLKNGSLPLFRLFGVNVYVHWTWAIAAYWLVSNRISFAKDHPGAAHPLGYHIGLVLGLFGIVLLHEFGHALACKSVGGSADTIVLWPLGGIAYVNPPQRPGAMLWSIAAGPLVNVILIPATIGALIASQTLDPASQIADFMSELATINVFLLIFNMFPIYPLDGVQIVRSLLWFFMGRATSLIVAAVIGIVGTVLLGAWAFYLMTMGQADIILVAIVLFMGFRCYSGIHIGILMRRLDRAPRHPEPRCPSCHENPPAGDFWGCPCGTRFDTFVTAAACPNCRRMFDATSCPRCGAASSLGMWYSAQAFPVLTSPAAPPTLSFSQTAPATGALPDDPAIPS